MVFIKDPIAQLFEVGYRLGLANGELCSRRLKWPKIRVDAAVSGALSAAKAVCDRRGTQRQRAAADALRLRLEGIVACSPVDRAIWAERVRGALAEARTSAALLSRNYGRPWLALGRAVAGWEMAGTRGGGTAFLHQCWRLARGLVSKQKKWLDSQIALAKKRRKRIGSLGGAIRDLFLDYWELDRAGKHYVAGVKVSLSEYKILVVLRLLDGRGLDTPALARLSGVKGAHNNLSALRQKLQIKELISRSNPAVWTDQYSPVPGPSAIPDDLASHLDWLDTPEALYEFLRARIKDIKA